MMTFEKLHLDDCITISIKLTKNLKASKALTKIFLIISLIFSLMV